MDVFDREPLPTGHPYTLLENTLLAPHTGYVTKEQYQVRYSETVENIVAFLEGRSLRVLNPDVLEASQRRSLS